jgi:hypothetical protein
MRAINYTAKAAHFADLAARAAYQAATCQAAGFDAEADHWGERSARYDVQAANYREAARRAA